MVPPQPQPKPSMMHHLLSLNKRLPHEQLNRNVWHMQNRYSSSLVPVKSAAPFESNSTRPHHHASVPNPRTVAVCEAGEASWVSDPGNFLSSAKQAELQESLDRLNFKT